MSSVAVWLKPTPISLARGGQTPLALALPAGSVAHARARGQKAVRARGTRMPVPPRGAMKCAPPSLLARPRPRTGRGRGASCPGRPCRTCARCGALPPCRRRGAESSCCAGVVCCCCEPRAGGRRAVLPLQPLRAWRFPSALRCRAVAPDLASACGAPSVGERHARQAPPWRGRQAHGGSVPAYLL